MKAGLELNNKPNKDGLYNILVRLQKGDKKTRQATPFFVKNRKHFDGQKKGAWISSKESNYASANKNLEALLAHYQDKIQEKFSSDPNIETKAIKHAALIGDPKESVVGFIEQQMEGQLNYNQRKGYRGTLNHWLDFCAISGLSQEVKFTQITENTLTAFKNYLLKQGKEEGTVHTNLKRLRAIFKKAKKQRLFKGGAENPFEFFTMPSSAPSKEKEKLTPAELISLLTQHYEHGSLSKTAQQVFKLGYCLQGARISDVLTLTWDDVKSEEYSVSYKMEKNGKPVITPFTEELIETLNYFRSIRKENSPFVVPLMEARFLKLKYSKDIEENETYKKEVSRKTALVNKYLRKIAADCGITKHISTHVNRNTLLNNSIRVTKGDAKKVRGMARHSSLATTDRYIAKETLENNAQLLDELTSLEKLAAMAEEDANIKKLLREKFESLRAKLAS